MNTSNVKDDFYVNIRTVYKEEFFRFCENTTIRGVPRIVKSRKVHIRYLWLTFFILLFIGFLVCIIFLCFQYLEYNVIHPPRILSDSKAPFPSLTVCNFRPMTRNIFAILKKLKIKSPRKFAQGINDYAIEHYFHRNLTDKYERSSSFMNMGAYLESVPNTTYKVLGHKLEDLIIHCQVTYMNGSNPQSRNCEDIGNWRIIVHPLYINCYSYNLDSEYSLKTNTIEIYFYLDQATPQEMCMDCFSSDVKSQLSGALILIHRRLTFPNFNHDIINLQPGTLTEIKLKIFNNVHKEPPYGRCSYTAPGKMLIYNDIYSYSEHACKLLTIQRDINTHCGCNAIEYPIENYNVPFCSYLPRFINSTFCLHKPNAAICKEQLDSVVNKINCKVNVSTKYNRDIIKSCPLPCDIYTYESDRSTSSWPTKTWQMIWLNTKTAKKLSSKPELKIYKKAYDQYLRGNVTQSFQILNQLNVLEQNLLAVMINRPNYNVHLVEEKEVLSLTSFLSQAGGLCSMWIGLTLISIVEVIEMILNCFTNLKSLNQEKKRRLSFISHNQDPDKSTHFQNQFCTNYQSDYPYIASANPIDSSMFLQNDPKKASDILLYNSINKYDII